MTKHDPFRSDAAVVYRRLRDAGPATASELAESCFPVVTEGPPTTIKALGKRSFRRVVDSLVWMRHHEVVLTAVPGENGAVFHVGAVPIDASRVARPLVLVPDGLAEAVTAKVSQGHQPSESLGGDAMDVWHGGNR